MPTVLGTTRKRGVDLLTPQPAALGGLVQAGVKASGGDFFHTLVRYAKQGGFRQGVVVQGRYNVRGSFQGISSFMRLSFNIQPLGGGQRFCASELLK